MGGNPATGNGYVFYIDQNATTDVTRDWVVVGGQTSADINRSVGEANTTDKDSNHESEFLATNKEGECTMDNLIELDDTGWQEMEAVHESRTIRYWYYTRSDGTIKYFKAIVRELNMSGPQDDVATASVTLRVTGGFLATEPA